MGPLVMMILGGFAFICALGAWALMGGNAWTGNAGCLNKAGGLVLAAVLLTAIVLLLIIANGGLG